MIRNLLLLLMCSMIGVSALHAQHNKMSREEFKAKQQAFLTQRAGLTEQEAKEFFPVYFELQDKKKELNDKAWDVMRQGKKPETTEKEYEKILDEVARLRIAADETELEYLKKFKKMLSSKKLYLIKKGELKFHRELLKPMKNKCK